MNVLESRIRVLEESLRRAWRAIDNLISRMTRAEQAIQSIGGTGGIPSAAGVAYFCMAPASGTWAATGTWPALTPGSFTADVYQTSGTSITRIAIGATVYNWYPASPANSKVLNVISDGAGNYVCVAQSCT